MSTAELLQPQSSTPNTPTSFSKAMGYVFMIGCVVSFILAFLPQMPRPYVPILIGVLAFLFGYILLFRRRELRTGTLPPSDQALFETNMLVNVTGGIEMYKVLRGLVGVPGFFRNLEIVGLPLATIAITVLFCLLAIICYVVNAFGREIIPNAFPAAILELSKLTLGAFIGSFAGKVQNKAASGSGKKRLPKPQSPIA